MTDEIENQDREGTVQPAPPPPPPPSAPAAAASAEPAGSKNPWLAAVLSAFPGVGNVYNGLYLRGVGFFLIIALLIVLAAETHPLFGFAIAFVWIFNVLDAYRQATLINYGLAGAPGRHRQPEASAGEKLLAGALLLVVGLVGALDEFFAIPAYRIFDLWPLLLLALGGWLLWAAFQDRRQPAATADDALDL